jgi:hypothetical protein
MATTVARRNAGLPTMPCFDASMVYKAQHLVFPSWAGGLPSLKKDTEDPRVFPRGADFVIAASDGRARPQLAADRRAGQCNCRGDK